MYSSKSGCIFSFHLEKPLSPVQRPKSATQKYVEDKVFGLTAAIEQDEEEEEVDYTHDAQREETEVDGESDCTSSNCYYISWSFYFNVT